MDNLETAKALSALPLTVLLLLVLVGGYVEWWIYGSIHRKSVEELEKQIVLERGRADRWEARFLDISTKLDVTLAKTTEVAHTVNGNSTAAVEKLTQLETQITALHTEISRIQELRIADARHKDIP